MCLINPTSLKDASPAGSPEFGATNDSAVSGTPATLHHRVSSPGALCRASFHQDLRLGPRGLRPEAAGALGIAEVSTLPGIHALSGGEEIGHSLSRKATSPTARRSCWSLSGMPRPLAPWRTWIRVSSQGEDSSLLSGTTCPRSLRRSSPPRGPTTDSSRPHFYSFCARAFQRSPPSWREDRASFTIFFLPACDSSTYTPNCDHRSTDPSLRQQRSS